MAVHDCFFHLVEWIEYDETEPKWEVIWKVKSVCSGAMIDFADDNKQTCVSQLEGEGCIVWREVLSSFYDIFTYCEWPDLSGLSNPPSCAVSSHSPSNRYHYDNQAAELLTALQHVERSEPERAQTIAVIEQLVSNKMSHILHQDPICAMGTVNYPLPILPGPLQQVNHIGVDEVSLRPPNNMDDDAGRTKKVGATSNKRLRDEDDSEDGDNSKEQNQQLSKRPRTDDETVNPEMLGFYRRKTHTLGKEERASPRAHVARPMMGVSYLSTMEMSGLDNDLWISPHGHDDFRDKRVRSNVNLDLAEQLPILPTR
uniref:Uncharacterized protein n=1 Tax=Gibberella zeae TaxID=5518 RepID=A0A4E9EM79_GIBZA